MKNYFDAVSRVMLLLLLVIAPTASRANLPSTPTEAVRQNITAVDQGRYQNAYTLLPKSIKSHISLEEFKNFKNQQMPSTGKGIEKLKAYFYFVSDFFRKSGYQYVPKGVSKENNNAVIVKVLTPSHKFIMMEIVTVKEDGSYKIDMEATATGLSSESRDTAREQLCTAKMKQLSIAMQMYLVDHGQYPKGNQWGDSLKPYLPNKDVFYCPAVASKVCGYAFNVNLAGKDSADVTHPDETVLLFESSAGKMNHADGGTTVCKPSRHPKGNVYLFADGSVVITKIKPNGKHSWKP